MVSPPEILISNSGRIGQFGRTKWSARAEFTIWEKYMLTVDEAVQYFGIGEKKIRMLISEHLNSECCFTVQVGCKSLINRKKFEAFLDQTTSL